MTVSEVIREMEHQASLMVARAAAALNHTWRVGPQCDWDSGITVPVISGPQCGVVASNGPRYQCTRASGHEGRHAATCRPEFGTKTRSVVAVWA